MDKNLILIELSESERTDLWREDFEKQSEPEKVFTAIWEIESQVNNGGFEQYYSNNVGPATLAFAPSALRAIGANDCAQIVERALAAAFRSKVPGTCAEVRLQLETLSDAERDELREATGSFIAYPDDLTELLYAYVCKRPEVFGPVPPA